MTKNVDSAVYITIVTPVFNRAKSVVDSVASSLRLLNDINERGEIVLVDDCSTDNSVQVIEERFADELSIGLVHLERLTRNIGVTGAKQFGATLAQGEWLIFMDSDDCFVQGCSEELISSLKSVPDGIPLVFFRCKNQKNGELIGEKLDSMIEIDLDDYLSKGTPGECLPAVRKRALLSIPYEKDLRGFEQITYARLIKSYGNARIYPGVMREYNDDESGNRLSTKASLRKRGCLLAKGYVRMIFVFRLRLKARIFGLLLRVFYHSFNCINNNYIFRKRSGNL